MPAFARTVRFRLTVWYSSLLLVFGVAFVVALNLAARLDQPTLFEIQGVRVDGMEVTPNRGPGAAIQARPDTVTLDVLLREAETQFYSDNLDRLRNWSLIAVVGLALASGVGGYVLSGMMLRPVRAITEAASEITASNLGRRINHQGPRDELWALAQTFDSMVDRLEHSFDRQRQFVQDASHELRTPLAAILTNIEVVEMDPEVTSEEYRELLETVKSQTARLTRLSEDLLLLTSDNRDQVESEPVRVAAVTAEVQRQLLPLAAARRVSLQLESAGDVEVSTNADLLYRCVFNLVDNAIKYSGEASRVAIRTRGEGTEALIQVADNGPGIAPDDLPHIFDRFYRVDKGRSRREGGTGLGLAIVQELVTAIGGNVNVESTLGVGTTFTIRLPRLEPAPPTLTATMRPAAYEGSPSS
jgi:signal transduction histidine kinase